MAAFIETVRRVRIAALSFVHYHANFWSEAFGDDPYVEFIGIWDDDAEHGGGTLRPFLPARSL
jgi:hypothetical protein